MTRRQAEREKSKQLGRELLEREFRKYGFAFAKVQKSGELDKAVEALKLQSQEELLVTVGYGKILPADVIEKIYRDSAKILIDITAAQRNQLDQAIAGGQVTAAESKANIVKPDEEHVIWPFNGEYWRDELGFYRQTITSKCGR